MAFLSVTCLVCPSLPTPSFREYSHQIPADTSLPAGKKYQQVVTRDYVPQNPFTPCRYFLHLNGSRSDLVSKRHGTDSRQPILRNFIFVSSCEDVSSQLKRLRRLSFVNLVSTQIGTATFTNMCHPKSYGGIYFGL